MADDHFTYRSRAPKTARHSPSRPKSTGAALLRRLLDLGVDPNSPPARVRWVRTINVVAMVSMALSVFFSLFYALFYFEILWPVCIANLICVAGYALGMMANARNHPRRAAWILLATGWANTIIPGAALGATTGVYLFLILVPMLGVLLSAPRDRLMQFTVVVFGAVTFTAIPILFPEAPPTVTGTAIERVLFVTSALAVCTFGSLVVLYYRQLMDDAESALAEANERSERLLLNTLPQPIAERLKRAEFPIADRADDVTVLFADIVNSTALSDRMSPDDLVALLNRVFSRFDDLCEQFGLEKITTIGDAYLAVSGLPFPRPDHVEAAAEVALAMRASLRDLNESELGMRFGMCSGPVVAGVIGKHKFRYDLWGDTVNLASRMQSHGEVDSIHATAEIYETLRDRFIFQPRGPIDVKGKGLMETYFLLGRRESDIDGEPRVRNGSKSATV